MCALRSCTLRLVQVEAVLCVWSVNMCMLYTDPFTNNTSFMTLVALMGSFLAVYFWGKASCLEP